MKRRLLALVGLAAAAGAALHWSGEVPRWSWTGTRIIAHEPLKPLGQFPLDLPPWAHVVLRGDSNTLGSRLEPDDAPLAALLDGGFSVEVLARGGATAADGLALWPPQQGADLCIIAFGSNDAAPRGLLSNRTPQPLVAFEQALAQLIAQCRTQTARVLVLAPWPSGSTAMEQRIAPYRSATRRVAATSNVAFRDPIEAFAGPAGQQTLLTRDALHLNGAAHRLVANWLSGLMG